MSTEAQKEDFQARLARINRGDVTVAEGLQVQERRPDANVPLTGTLRENAVYPLSIVGAFFLGMIAVFFGRFARVHLLGQMDPETDLMLALFADGALAFAIGFAIKELFRVEGAEFISAQGAGITVMIGTMHNLVHLWPDLFEMIFTPEWVQVTLEHTKFRTVLYGANEFPF